jgi:hypothetical protein
MTRQQRHRERRLAEYARIRALSTPEHTVSVDKDWGKAFRSRPGSADWLAQCSCGWQSSRHYYGETEAWLGAERHLRRAG